MSEKAKYVRHRPSLVNVANDILDDHVLLLYGFSISLKASHINETMHCAIVPEFDIHSADMNLRLRSSRSPALNPFEPNWAAIECIVRPSESAASNSYRRLEDTKEIMISYGFPIFVESLPR
ncbi:hypothetical protein NPIL_257191 [Nephila pilipes]|uniref:Uncharacterized protein n=1 Tax=Nephila pilipes TaxID=299642 RepID=A0A8X6TG79_NEPPI|nr:hypothetical protein NPIL_257191 [Nephila pilipes]